MLNARQRIWGVEPARRTRRQLSLAEVRTRGGPRPGAGRKRVDPTARPNVEHRVRPVHVGERPVHVTLRRAKRLPGFRAERLRSLLEQAIRDSQRGDFRIAHYSIQADHLHLILEADDPAALTRGMRSLTVRIAMRLNKRVLRRTSGRVWGDRYHRRDLVGPRAVRNALVYLFANHLKHGEYEVGLIDPCSSAAWFTGWMPTAHALDPPPRRAPPVQPPTTWVLREGWLTRGGGRIHVGEVPRALRTT
jgi:REP element-mobilizing transposase RayT